MQLSVLRFITIMNVLNRRPRRNDDAKKNSEICSQLLMAAGMGKGFSSPFSCAFFGGLTPCIYLPLD